MVIFLAAMLATPALAQEVKPTVLAAEYGGETTRYDHGILGDGIEYGTLVLTVDKCPICTVSVIETVTITLPENRVFEDFSPRVVDLDHDGLNEVVVVETDLQLGAQLAVYGPVGKITATQFLGRSHRWLAPIGIADFNGDSLMDIAYIEKPHLTKILKIVTYENEGLHQIMEIAGLTNHRIGDDFISGGVRVCAGAVEMITADATWQNIIATQIIDQKPEFATLGRFTGPQSFADAMACR